MKIEKGFENISRYLLKSRDVKRILKDVGTIGVESLKIHTPIDTGKTADSWYFEIKSDRNRHTLYFLNDNSNEFASIALLIQYGHANDGYYVRGRDYINPALSPALAELEARVRRLYE